MQRCNGAPEPCPCHADGPGEVGRLDRHGGGAPPGEVPAGALEVLREPGEAIPVGMRAALEAGFAGRLGAINQAPAPLQGRSRISSPQDASERQAEAVAQQVVRQRDAGAAGAGQQGAAEQPDFSGVRLHSGPAAARAARSVHASAYTVGRHVVLAEPLTDTGSGRTLLAHELAHVVQQARTPSLGEVATVQRKCPHDGKGTGCYAAPSLGKVTLTDPSGVSMVHDIGDLVVENMQARFGGRFLPRVTVPASGKSTSHGFVDGLKVTLGSTLRVEVVEVKARSEFGGGCDLADSEAAGYRDALAMMTADFVAVSRGLAAAGGLRVPLGAKADPAAAAMLLHVGATGTNPGRWRAWTFYNSLQNRLGITFTTAFDGLDVEVNKDGVPGQDYTAAPPWIITCRRGGKSVPGTTTLTYEVSGKGGVSYGCNKKCFEEEERRKRKQKQPEAQRDTSRDVRVKQEGEEPEIREPDQPGQPGQPVHPVPPVQLPGKEGGESEIREPDQPGQPGKEAPPPADSTYIPELLAAAAALSAAAVTAKTIAEKKALEAAYQRTLAMLAEKGAKETAEKLMINGVKLGTKQLAAKFEKEAVETLTKDFEKLALKEGEKLAGKAAKTAARKAAGKALARAVPFLTVVLVASDALAMANHVRKGGTIEIGLTAPEADLKGDTKVKTQGGKGGAVEGTLKDTKIDITTTGVPDVSGTTSIEADNVTITGSVTGDGTPVTLTFTTKLKNTTITIKHGGVIKGGKVALGGDSTITDSQIEIDLPKDAAAAGPGKPITLKGQKLKITQVGTGSGTGTPGASGTGSVPAPQPEAPAPDTVAADKRLEKLGEETRRRLDAAGKATQEFIAAMLVSAEKGGVKADDAAVSAILAKLQENKVTEAELAKLKKNLTGRTTSLAELLKKLDDGINGIRGKTGKEGTEAGIEGSPDAAKQKPPPVSATGPPPKPVDPADPKFRGLESTSLRIAWPKDSPVGTTLTGRPAWGKLNGVPWEATVDIKVVEDGAEILSSTDLRTPTGTHKPWFKGKTARILGKPRRKKP